MELRQPVKTFLLKKPSKPTTKIELFPATKWRRVYKPGRQNVFPRPPSLAEERNEFWETIFRLRVDGRWYNPEGKREKYVFFTTQELKELLVEL